MSVGARTFGNRAGAAAERRPPSSHIVQGEQRITADPDAVLSTVLGSCVSACLLDPVARLGGMNHFLLPGDFEEATSTGERLGVHAMELLINQLLAAGASRKRLEAKVFGGANLNTSLANIGSANAAFARQFLSREDIPITAECLGGNLGRRVQFWPVSGRARRSFLPPSDKAVRSLPTTTTTPPAPSAGSLELF